MELSIITRLKITAVLLLGILVIGILAWPLVRPGDGFGTVTSFSGDISLFDIVILALLAFIVGLAAYFVSWPHGREIGILAVPAGLCIWAGRSGEMAQLLRHNLSMLQRRSVYSALRWEGFFWLAIVAVGFAGVVLAQKIVPAKPRVSFESESDKFHTKKKYLYTVTSILSSIVVAQICISLLARNTTMFDEELGVVLGQPVVAQICFAVLIAFGFAAFLSKLLLNANYIWPALGTALLNLSVMTAAGRLCIVKSLVDNWPASFHAEAVSSILPVQLVAFGTLGSVIGFWLAIRYKYWKKHKNLNN
jgi:hypothetical protein